MKIRQGFIAIAFVAGIIAAFSKIIIWTIQYDPKTFGLQGLRIVSKLQIAFEGGLLLSIALICLGLLGRQSTNRYAYDRGDDD